MSDVVDLTTTLCRQIRKEIANLETKNIPDTTLRMRLAAIHIQNRKNHSLQELIRERNHILERERSDTEYHEASK